MPTAFSPDYTSFTEAAKYAVPDRGFFDNAAARIRSRLDSKQRSNARAIQDKYAGRGAAFSGSHDRAQRLNTENINMEYGQALGQFETDFMKGQQEGAKILSDIGTAKNAATTSAANASRGFLEALGNNAGIFGLIQDKNPQGSPWSNFWESIYGGPFNLPNSSEIIASVGGVQPGGGTGGTTTTDTSTGGGTTTDVGGSVTPEGGLGGGASVGSNPANVPVGDTKYQSQVEDYLKNYGALPKYVLDNIMAYYGTQPDWLVALKAKYNIPNRYWGTGN